ncbi:hypothetical protein OESDEN_04709 [Oesophagostomum dentatum]|uniref:Uncharacterized protein n=1 Tax=Oesophagostomum dentatum TaxID=61180 RepID=A0A0B1TCR5_OESDE|nr:hypothetical protein OESDEN_04709 [Oesophagostomum dentatum]
MATRKMNFFERLANMFGCIYRHQAAQFPRRWEILKAVGKHELAPPKATDWPAIKGDWKKVTQFIATKQYKELTVRVPSDYVSRDTRKKVKALEAEARELAKH